MDGFIRYIIKMAVISGSILAVILLVIISILLSVPQLLLQILYYALIIGCAAGAGYVLVCLIRMLLSFLCWKDN